MRLPAGVVPTKRYWTRDQEAAPPQACHSQPWEPWMEMRMWWLAWKYQISSPEIWVQPVLEANDAAVESAVLDGVEAD